MCGFSVFLRSVALSDGERPELPDGFAATLETLHHRGPDETCHHADEDGVFGFKRLATIDVENSHQPLHYPPTGPEAGRWTVTMNGDIYNYRELRAELIREHGAAFTTDGDTEVLAAAFHQWGPAALPRLRGMFACVLWDRRTRTMHAARDMFGIKPLHYLLDADGLRLASEKKALLPYLSDRAAVDTDQLAHYLSMQYVPEPNTLHAEIMRLGPGRRMTWTPGGEVRVERWFRPAFAPVRTSLDEASGRILAALRDSVKAHMVADVPVGAFLSSGIDSTAVVALAREHNPDLRVFTAGFADSSYSEVDVAAESAAHLGVRMTPALVSQDDVINHLPLIAWHLDDPVADPALVPLYFLARTASRYVTVVLSGEGADELFGGYTIYREPASLAGIGKLPVPMQRGLRSLSNVMPEGFKGKSFLDRGTTPIEERYHGNARIFGPAEKRLLMRSAHAPHTVVTAQAYAESAGLDDVAAMQYVDLHTWLTGDILTKADRMSMAHAIMLRVPFLDPAVWESAASLPTDLKLPPNSSTTKWALRQALRDVVPAPIVNRPKLGFPTPTKAWLRGPIGEWAGDVIGSSQTGHLLDKAYALRLLGEHRAGRADHARKIWTVLMFCLWHQITVEGTIDPHAAVRPDLPHAAVA